MEAHSPTRRNENCGRAALPSTHWSSVAAAGDDPPRLGAVLRRYEPALAAHLRARFRLSPHDAQDALQSFFTDAMIERNLLRLADPARGRFRSFLLTALDHHVRNWLRDRRAKKRSPDAAVSAIDEVTPPADREASPDRAFELTWAREVVAQAVERMRAECEAAGQLVLWQLFSARVLSPALNGAAGESYGDLVTRLGLATPAQAANVLVTAKRRFARTLKAVVSDYLSDPADADAEIVDLRRILAAAGA
jgi:RNA polymerase sigma factor (sigma-70 family)